MPSAKAPTPGSTTPSARRTAVGSAVTSGSRPERSSALATLLRFPAPKSTTAIAGGRGIAGQRAPFTVGRPFTRGSRSTAVRRARARPLKQASTTWCGLLP
jgi:hypothetical protein